MGLSIYFDIVLGRTWKYLNSNFPNLQKLNLEPENWTSNLPNLLKTSNLSSWMGKNGWFSEVFSSIPTLKHTEPLICPQKPNFKPIKPRTERGSTHHYFDTHLFFHISIPAHSLRSWKKFHFGHFQKDKNPMFPKNLHKITRYLSWFWKKSSFWISQNPGSKFSAT